jgi:hypothetical protein
VVEVAAVELCQVFTLLLVVVVEQVVIEQQQDLQ